MIADIAAVMWKEWRELFLVRGSVRSTLLTLILPLGIVSIFLPLQTGPTWVRSPLLLVAWAWLPLFLVVNVVADSFAGERERHTLETLLASRLPDRAILFGKVATAVAYAWGLTLLMLIVSLVAVNVAYGRDGLLLYAPELAIAAIGLSLCAAVLAAAAGVLVSLRAATARQAQQSVNIALMLFLFVPVFGVQLLPEEWRARLAGLFVGADPNVVLAIVVVAFVVVDAALLSAGLARFQRARLILD
jgi:ABC-2 type transport system permease protein